ncbi:hypothetical protein FQA39_LY12800 [Lamprigera yunnana]|nr:hypothetical protein FQA39_LY12800 [Lamprigera yunnana]
MVAMKQKENINGVIFYKPEQKVLEDSLNRFSCKLRYGLGYPFGYFVSKKYVDDFKNFSIEYPREGKIINDNTIEFNSFEHAFYDMKVLKEFTKINLDLSKYKTSEFYIDGISCLSILNNKPTIIYGSGDSFKAQEIQKATTPIYGSALALLPTTAMTMFAYSGIDSITYVTGEVENPHNFIPENETKLTNLEIKITPDFTEHIEDVTLEANFLNYIKSDNKIETASIRTGISYTPDQVGSNKLKETTFDLHPVLLTAHTTNNESVIVEGVSKKVKESSNENEYFHTFMADAFHNYGVYNVEDNTTQKEDYVLNTGPNRSFQNILNYVNDDFYYSGVKGETVYAQLILATKEELNDIEILFQSADYMKSQGVEVSIKKEGFVYNTWTDNSTKRP